MNDVKRLRVAILGCTGSIGAQALDVCRQHIDKLEVVAVSVHRNTKGLVRAAREFGVRSACVADPAHANDPILEELPASCELTSGSSALAALCERDDVDCVLNAVVGAAGLSASIAALKAGKRLALANKESLVVGGDLIMPLAAPDQLLPVDSEHGAIFQCLVGDRRSPLHAIWLTCSGHLLRQEPQLPRARDGRPGTSPSCVVHGSQDFHRLRDAHEQRARAY